MKGITIFSLVCVLFSSCQRGDFFEKNIVIPNQSWDYDFKPEFQLEVTDKKALYDLYLELRHTGYYKYSDISLMVNQNGLSIKDSINQYKIKLADSDGKWIGKSAGNLYGQSKLIQQDISFPDTGIYTFHLQQNMIENPLIGINDVGIKLIKK